MIGLRALGGRRRAIRLASAACLGAIASGIVATASVASPASGAASTGGWTITKLPEPAGAFFHSFGPTAISCPSVTWCKGAGNYFTSSNLSDTADATIAWSGGKWTVWPRSQGHLTSMACPSSSLCVAGGYSDGSPMKPRLLTWSAGAWQGQRAPLPPDAAANPGSSVTGLSCPRVSWCAGSGYYADVHGRARGMLLTRLNGSWTAASAPEPLIAVSCPNTSLCFATAPGPLYQPTVLTWSRGTWTTTVLPLPAGAAVNPQVFLGAITCPSATMCAAAGSYMPATGPEQGLLAWLVSGKWHVRTAPHPAGAASAGWSVLQGVSCPSATRCTAAGEYVNADGKQPALIANWQFGHGWKASSSPDMTVNVTGISCPSTTRCFAVASGPGSSALVLTGP